VRILYFADTRFPIERANGVQTMATCHALAERGHDVTLVVRPDTAERPRDPFAFYGLPAEPRLSIAPVAGPKAAALRRAQFLLAALSRTQAHRGHVVFTRDLGVASFLLQAPALRRPRVVYESHGVADVVAAELPALLGASVPMPSPAKLARLSRREARVWRNAASYVTITNALAVELAGRFGPRERLFVVPDGARESSTHAPPARTDEKGLVVGYAGHLYPWKGVDVLIAALSEVPSARAVIVGGHVAEPDRARVSQLAIAKGVAERVTFTGPVPHAEVAAHLSAANVLVLPNTSSAISERYTSPLKLFEYLSLGRAIVASDLPSFREVLTANETALLVPPGDAVALGQALAQLAANPTLRQGLADRAAALAPEYTWSRRAERLERAIEAAIP
jgi:glycosyltransferase involved in cell wall biosynthesis